MQHHMINPWPWSLQLGYSQAVKLENPTTCLLCSGQTSVDDRGQLKHKGNMRAQMQLSLDNLKAILTAADMDFQHIKRLTIYTLDALSTLKNMDLIQARFLGFEPKPAMSLIGVAALAMPDLMIELEASAYL